MTDFASAASVWIAPSGVIPQAMRFDLVPGAGWMIIVGLLAAVCALLAMAIDPRVFGRRRRLRLVRGTAKRPPQPQHA